MVRILAAGDFHGNNIFTRQLAEKALNENADIVVLCGDITEHGSEHRDDLIAPFLRLGKKVLLVTGNHDSFVTGDILADVYDVKHIHGKGLRYDHVGIVGCSGANIGLEPLSEEEIFNVLKKGFEKVSYLDKKIFVTHIFPSGSLMDKMSHSNLPGSSGLTKAIMELKPDILFCSHAHEAEGVEEVIGNTRVICVGRSGKFVEI